jgi:hypothetical protein
MALKTARKLLGKKPMFFAKFNALPYVPLCIFLDSSIKKTETLCKALN